jgi:hypothetical protein
MDLRIREASGQICFNQLGELLMFGEFLASIHMEFARGRSAYAQSRLTLDLSGRLERLGLLGAHSQAGQWLVVSA